MIDKDGNGQPDILEESDSSPKILTINEAASKIPDAIRVGYTLKDKVYYRTSSYLSEQQLLDGETFLVIGKDNNFYTLLQVKGELNGNMGIYEYLVDINGNVTHQSFINGGTIIGTINVW